MRPLFRECFPFGSDAAFLVLKLAAADDLPKDGIAGNGIRGRGQNRLEQFGEEKRLLVVRTAAADELDESGGVVPEDGELVEEAGVELDVRVTAERIKPLVLARS